MGRVGSGPKIWTGVQLQVQMLPQSMQHIYMTELDLDLTVLSSLINLPLAICSLDTLTVSITTLFWHTVHYVATFPLQMYFRLPDDDVTL